MTESEPKTLQYQCCFCGESGSALDPCAVVLIARWERPEAEQGVQQFFCHVLCFQRVSKHAPVEMEVLEQGTA